MTKKQKLGYMLSEWVIGLSFAYLIVIALIHTIYSDDPPTLERYLTEAATILATGVMMFAPLMLQKWWMIRCSKDRTVTKNPLGL